MADLVGHIACLTQSVMLRQRVAQSLEALGFLDAALRAPPWLRAGWLPVLNYHRIHPSALDQAFDRGVIDATPAEFERQMTVLGHYFTPIDLTELVEHFARSRPLPDNAVMVTFDDGYRECLTRALPVLRSRGVKATFFISTGHVGQRRVFWWDRLSFLVRSSLEERLELHYPRRLTFELPPERDRVIGQLLRLAKDTYDLDFGRFLGELATATGVRWDAERERRAADELVMTWDDVRKLRDAGMDIQSHTRTHRILQHIRPEELPDELAGSRDDLQAALGVRPRGIAYPVGRPIAHYPHVVQAVRDAGYEIGFSTAGPSWPRDFHPLDLGRIVLDRGVSDAMFRTLLIHPVFSAT